MFTSFTPYLRREPNPMKYKILSNEDLAAGIIVKHAQFGKGKVVEMRQSTYVVEFETFGRKEFYKNFSEHKFKRLVETNYE